MMTKKQAIEYLQRKKKDATEEEIKKVMKSGKIYGDPISYIQW